MDIEEVARDEYGILRQERKKRHLFADSRQFRHNLHPVALVLRQLRLDLEGTDGVDVVAEEIDTERQFTAERIDVEDTAAQSELARFIDIVNLAESQFTQGIHGTVDIHRLALPQHQHPLV